LTNIFGQATGKTLLFDQTDSKKAETQPDQILISNPFTIEFWAKRASSCTSNFLPAASYGNKLQIGFIASGQFFFEFFGLSTLTTLGLYIR
jgi:hypothetical protein